MNQRTRKPDWLKIKLPLGTKYTEVKRIVQTHNLHTICSSGHCPNMGECWGAGTATFMVAGDICTRSCKFCATKSGKPNPLNIDEPKELAKSIQLMKLKHAVVTSVDRDDLADGGAQHWIDCVHEIKRVNPNTTLEILVPDFDGRSELIRDVALAGADIVSHNMETIARLTPQVRSRAKYDLSLQVLREISKTGVTCKSGIMVGLGETDAEVTQILKDVHETGCQVFTIGQYLQPTAKHLPVEEYIHPDQFKAYKQIGEDIGFRIVESAPLVRSSYHAEKHVCGSK